MTVKHPIDAGPAAPAGLRPAAATTDTDALLTDALDASSAAAVRSDAIVLSERAKALLRAGLASRAFVLPAISTLFRTVEIAAGIHVAIEGGIYRAVSGR